MYGDYTYSVTTDAFSQRDEMGKVFGTCLGLFFP